jgi:DNA-binding beta-propeller fold protein YncE
MKYFLAIGMLFLGVNVGAAFAEIPNGLIGTLIVLNKSSNNASFIDLASGLTIATLPTGTGPHELVVSDDGLMAVGTDYGGGDSLTVFDVQNLKVARTIDLSDYPRPHGIQFLPGQAEVVVTSETNGELVVVNLLSGSILGSVATSGRGSHMVALGQSGELAFTSNLESNNVSVINLSRGRMQAAFRVPGRPEAITVNKEATEIWVGSNDEGVVSVLNSATGKVTAQWLGFSWPYRILLSNDEQLAVIPDMNNNDLRFINAVNKQEVGKIELGEASPQGVVFHPNDQVLFISLASNNTVLVIDRESRAILGEYETGLAPDGIGYSPLVLN